MSEKMISIFTNKNSDIRRLMATVLTVVIVMTQGIMSVSGAEVGNGLSKRIKNPDGCKHNCWTDPECQDILWEILEDDPELYAVIADAMSEYDLEGYGPASDRGDDQKATSSDAEKATPSEAEKATPSEAEEASPSEAEEASPSEAEEATPSEAKRKYSKKYKISKDGRLTLKDCEHVHDEECGYYAWKTVYTYEDDEVTIKAVMTAAREDALPEGSELTADRITDPDELKSITEQIANETGQIYDCSQSYDIRFEHDGTEIEPVDATIKVQLQYKDPVEIGDLTSETEDGEIERNVKIFHLSDSKGLQDLDGEIARNLSGNLKSATFETDSFSIFVLTRMLENGTLFTYEDDEMVMTASVSEEAGIPADASLVVDVIGEEDPRYQAAKKQMEESAAGAAEDNSGNTVPQMIDETGLLLYEFSFLNVFDEVIEVEDIGLTLDIEYKEPKSLLENKVQLLQVMNNEENVFGGENENIMVYQMSAGNKLSQLNATVDNTDSGVQKVSANLTSGNSGVMMFGLGNIRTSALESYISDAYPERSYRLYYILNHFNFFVKENASCSHVVGAFATGGNCNITAGMGGISYKPDLYDYNNYYLMETNSYVGGKIGNFLPYNPDRASWITWSNAGRPFGYVKNEPDVLPAPSYLYMNKEENNNQEYTGYKHNPDYLDMEAAFAAISDEIDGYVDNPANISIKNGSGVNCEKTSNGFAARSGYAYTTDNLSQYGIINVKTDDASKKGNIIFICNAEGSVQMPQVYFNGKGYDTSRKEKDQTGVIFILPNATKITFSGGSQEFVGHIIAPNADVVKRGSNYSGCVVAKNFDYNSESHMYPSGSLEMDTYTGFFFEKQINGKGITDGKTFKFQMQEVLNKSSDGTFGEYGWETTVSNSSDGKIHFTTASHPYETAGTYHYLIHEVDGSKNANDPDDYAYDPTYYYIEVVTADSSPDELDLIQRTPQIVSVTGWKWEYNDNPLQGHVIEATETDMLSETYEPLIFNNRTGQDYTNFFFTKRINEKQPENKENFQFELKEVMDREGILEEKADGHKQQVRSDEVTGAIEFTTNTYTESGTYKYLVHEVSDSKKLEDKNAYVYDQSYYYIEVNVNNNNGKIQVSSTKCWKWIYESNPLTGTKGDEVDVSQASSTGAVFNNTVEQVLLPETGGPGTRFPVSTGFWLFTLGLMALVFSQADTEKQSLRKRVKK